MSYYNPGWNQGYGQLQPPRYFKTPPPVPVYESLAAYGIPDDPPPPPPPGMVFFNGKYYIDPRVRGTFVTPRRPSRQRAIQRVPPEIWQDIMALCIPSLEDQERIPLSHAKAPMSLTHISAGLRRLVLGTPGFWTSLVIIPSETGALPSEETVTLWLSCSRGLPLNLAIGSGWRNVEPRSMRQVQRVFRAFLREIQRWRNVTLDIRWTKVLEPRLAAAPANLRSLTIYGGCGTNSLTPFFETFLTSTGNMKTFNWVDRDPRNTLFMFHGNLRVHCRYGIAAQRLTRLNLGLAIFAEEALALLMMAPNLVTMEFHNLFVAEQIFRDYNPKEGDYVPPAFPPSKNAIFLPHLREMKLSGNFMTYLPPRLQPYDPNPRILENVIGRILDQLNTPSLATATFFRFDTWDAGAFCRWYKASGCQLSSLSLTDINMRPEALAKTLESCRTVGSLTLFTGASDCSLTSSVVAAMTPNPRGSYLLPMLQRISVDADTLQHSEQDAGCFAKMLKARCKAAPRYLQSVHINAANKQSNCRPDHEVLREFADRYRLEYQIVNYHATYRERSPPSRWAHTEFKPMHFPLPEDAPRRVRQKPRLDMSEWINEAYL